MPSPEQRPQSIEEFRRALLGGAVVHKPLPLSALATVRRGGQAKAAISAPGGTAAALDDTTLAKLVSALATHIGPIASKIVHSQLRKGAPREEFIRRLASEIADERARVAFVVF